MVQKKMSNKKKQQLIKELVLQGQNGTASLQEEIYYNTN